MNGHLDRRILIIVVTKSRGKQPGREKTELIKIIIGENIFNIIDDITRTFLLISRYDITKYSYLIIFYKIIWMRKVDQKLTQE